MEFDLIPIESTDKKIHPPRFDLERAIEEDVLFIDDQSYGTPLKKAVMTHGMMVDWDELEVLLKEHNIL